MNGNMTRKNMLETFSAMLKPARMIVNMSRQELAELSGLDEPLIEAVEDGRTSLQKTHYLALAAVFDNMKYQEEGNIYRALLRILTPEKDADSSGEAEDFVLVRRWLGTFGGGTVYDAAGFESGEQFTLDDDDDSDDDDSDSDSDTDGEERLPDSELEDIAANCKIIADASAIGNENFPALVTRLEPLLRQADAVITVPQTAVDELQETISSSSSEDEKLNLSDALKYIARKENEGLISIRSYDFDGDSDEIISELFDRDGGENHFMLITQNYRVYWDNVSGRGNVWAAHIDDKGDLILWGDEVFGV